MTMLKTGRDAASRLSYVGLSITIYLLYLLWLIPSSAHAASFPIIGMLHTEGHPEAMALDTRTHLLYIANENPGKITAFDPLDGTVHWTFTAPGITDLQVDSSTHIVYALTAGSGSNSTQLLSIAGMTGSVLTTNGIGPNNGNDSITLDTPHHTIYISNAASQLIWVLDLHNPTSHMTASSDPRLRSGSTLYTPSANFKVLTSWQLKVHPGAIAINSRLGRLYVASETSVSVLDIKNGHILTSIPVADLPLAPLRIDEQTGYVYVVCSTGQELDIIDGHSNTVIARTAVAPYPEGMAVNTATGRIYIADEGEKEGAPAPAHPGNTLTVLDSHSFTPLGTFAIGGSPNGVIADPALQRIYVALEDTGAIVELSDSVDLPLQIDAIHQEAIARQTQIILQWAIRIVFSAMLLTIAGSLLGALSPRWRAQGNPRTQPGDAQSH